MSETRDYCARCKELEEMVAGLKALENKVTQRYYNEWMAAGERYTKAEADLASARAKLPPLIAESRTLEADNARLRAALEDFAELDCVYGDGCPSFAGTRHGTCTGCKARAALAPQNLDAGPPPQTAAPADKG